MGLGSTYDLDRDLTDDPIAVTTSQLGFRGGIVVMALLAAAKLADEMLRLVWRSGTTAALDLESRHLEVHGWFEGVDVYGTMMAPTYPPASHVLLWPFLGWLPFEPARWLWAATTVVALAAMTWLILRETGATGAWQRAFAALMLLAMNQTGVTVGNGQLILHVLPPLVFGILLIHRGRGSLGEDVAASALIVFAMVKVTLAAPFLWLVLFAPTDRALGVRLRPSILVAAAYVAMTVFAASFQDGSVVDQLREWVRVAERVSADGGDYANLSAWLIAAGHASLVSLVSVIVFFALGAWLFRYRRVDLWVRLGVVAIVARFWAYHRLYDDVLVILALIALFRVAKSVSSDVEGASERHIRAVATGLIATCMLFMLLPARLGTSPAPWYQLFNVSHATTWAGMLVFLGWYAANKDHGSAVIDARPPVVMPQ